MQERRRNVAALLAASVLLGLSNTAAAIPVHVTAGGFFPEQGSPLVADGTEWSIDLVYESSAQDLTPNLVTEGLYAAYQSLSLSIGDQLYSLSDFEASRTNIQVFNDRVSNGGVAYRDLLRFAGGITGTTLNFNLISAFGYDQPGGGPLSSDALLSDPAALTSLFHNQQDPGWEFTDFIFFDLQPGQTGTSVFAVGTVDRFSASALSVSEPGTLPLLSLGLLMAFGLRRRCNLNYG
ncbi:MAG TPA: PEP-CTERM sorting domain-containing protein [Steroidobacteraceae bacterium]|nr:PEP-CTERM sorting domain-containing protein [Steroidobacteraceae bacterium]